ncbi:seizure threshold 2 [Seminavis robusta]|uniref:Seizure threshold 2 n=1 Tax=Seminavis robusta TaxID=568900 RepID=A0A9N8E1N9_9STRA|nr:seizure threshold 2 [Seminavis robusta]|eukprot:Sro528_g160790.1 seizure threshold 2 (2864) ;mRNA; f:6878-16206
MGDAVTTTLLLSDWERYGLSERVCYHFDLTEALASSSQQQAPPHGAPPSTGSDPEGGNASVDSTTGTQDRPTTSPPASNPNDTPNDTSAADEAAVATSFQEQVCGVAGILECVPFTPLNRLTKRQKRALRNEIRDFNLECLRIKDDKKKKIACHEPRRLPLRLNPASRLFFAYEKTRICFCLDASPSLTSTFGGNIMDDTTVVCPMDRVASMARTFFTSLVEPIEAPSIPIAKVWRPEIAVSVIAVYPRGMGLPTTSLLVRDYRVYDKQSAETLVHHLEEWALQEVESEIARRLSQKQNPASNSSLLAGYDAWSIQLHSSSLRDILDVGDVSLSILSSAAKPCIVVATDGRSVSCDGVIDILTDANRSDVPLVVLDLSSPQSHSQHHHAENNNQAAGEAPQRSYYDLLSLIHYDPGGPSTFPLHLSDDTEALHGICRATGGCFFDAELLQQAAVTKAGQIEESPFHADHYFSFKRRSVKPNAVQWYLLFSLSPLSPTFSSSWGKIIPPRYLRQRPQSNNNNFITSPDTIMTTERRPWENNHRQSPTSDIRRVDVVQQQRSNKALSRTTFSTYIVSPIRIKGLVMMRVKEGYRAKQYGQSTQDTDKVGIQFNLPLELGTVLHYELSYKALPNQSHMVGVAHIKIELSGEPGFIQSVKNDFLRQTHVGGRPVVTMAQQISARLCKILLWIRREDCLQSYLCPLVWSDQLASPETPFVRRLRTLTGLQRRKHFRFDQFDVVCTGRMPYALDDGFLSEFLGSDNGEQELIDFMEEWSAQTIKPGCRYIKQTDGSGSKALANYCVVELSQSQAASRVFTISCEFFGSTGAPDRLELIAGLKDELSNLRDVEVLSKQMADYLVGVRKQQDWDPHLRWKRSLLEDQHHHASWDLVKDPELLPLLMKRRTEIGMFILLDSRDDYALFAKLVPSYKQTGEEDLIQYQIAILADCVVIEIYMESTCGDFVPFRTTVERQDQPMTQFHKFVKTLKRRDQECGRALRCRTVLLKAFESDDGGYNDEEAEVSCVQRLLPYANKVTRRLRFFHPGTGCANDALQSLSGGLLLTNMFGVQAAPLPINPKENLGGLGSGSWFIIRFDRHTMSIVHQSRIDQQEIGTEEQGCYTYRELTYFTIGISDLYSMREDIADDDSTNSHISEYLTMVEFADHWDAAHTKIYATAAYVALRHESIPVESFHTDDLDRVLGVCDFVQVASVLVGGVPTGTSDSDVVNEGESKLQELIFTILGEVGGYQGGDYTLFYYKRGGEEVLKLDEQETESLSTFDELDAMGNVELEEEDPDNDRLTRSIDDNSATVDFASRSDDGYERQPGTGEDHARGHDTNAPSDIKELLAPPVFVRFTLDGKAATLNDLSLITKSSNLEAHLSIFLKDGQKSSNKVVEQQSQLPAFHGKVALELVALMNAYVAEQTLERLRHFGQELREDDLKVVKSCLLGARNVIRSRIEVFFYSTKIDAMVPALAPAGREAAIEEGFKLLKKELLKNDLITLRAFAGDVFVAIDSKGGNTLDFWCFISLKRTHISVKVHHSQGAETAFEVMSKVQEMISRCCHRVNQLRLLNQLHRSRTASELLIPKDTMVIEEPEGDAEQLFRSGVFRCPVVFRTSFDLFHRCATNPAQVARKLESTVLHSFAVSNRRNAFVYKDETGDVFYMMLEPRGGGVEPDGQIDLLVYGIQEPGPSITSQLAQLLQRRLLLIAVDMLSAVLTKNPHFHWKRQDLDFIHSFEEDWRRLDETHDNKPEDQCVEYIFPRYPTDPGMILLYFRQNLCGSTFFHRLHKSVGEVKYDKNEFESEEVQFNENDFTFYYNNSPSKLDPGFQPWSTLTEKGAGYMRQAGSGIAIIKVALVATGSFLPVEEKIRFGVPLAELGNNAPLETMRMIRAKAGDEDETHFEGQPAIRIRVGIASTALKLAALHSWVLLTLDQVYSAWCVERHLERMQRNLIPRPLVQLVSSDAASKETDIESIYPGLRALMSFIDSNFDLPHPALEKTVSEGMIRASSVAAVAMKFMESFVSLVEQEVGKNTPASQKPAISDIFVIRLSRSAQPQVVQLDYNARKKDVVARALQRDGKGVAFRDKPIDCPEYILFFLDPTKYAETGRAPMSLPLMFKEVVVDDGNSDKSASICHLEALKGSSPETFYRNFAFIVSVKRNRRLFLSYNWAPQALKAIASTMLENDRALLKKASVSTDSLQQRALRSLAPPSEGMGKKVSNEADNYSVKSERTSTTSSSHPSENQSGGPSTGNGSYKPRISRPTFIRRPKLIGKSVEGAAMQAVAASRARASNKQRFPSRGAAATTASSQPQRPPDGRASVQSATATSQRKAQTNQAALVNRTQASAQSDEFFAAARKRFALLLAGSSATMRVWSSQHWHSVQRLTKLWWPSRANTMIPRSVGEFILSQVPRTWSDAREVPHVPTTLLNSFAISLAQTIRMWNPGVLLVPVPSQDMGKLNSVLLMGEMKAVSSCRCLVIFKFSVSKFGGKGRQRNVLRGQGWTVTLPRHLKESRNNRLLVNAAMAEKDGAGIDRQSVELHSSLDLDCLILDFLGFSIERAMRSLDNRLSTGDIIPLIKTLINRYPLSRQKEMRRLNYRVFEADIVLASYENRLINFYDSYVHYEWLRAHAADRSLVLCGSDGLCFKKEVILANGVHSICFLTCDKTEPEKMHLLIVARTEGKDLHEYIFVSGPHYDYGMTMRDTIAGEAAGIVYAELRAAAWDLRSNELWKKVATRTGGEAVSEEDVDELLVLVPPIPLLENLSQVDQERIAMVMGSGLDLLNCCAAMQSEPAFSPSHSFTSSDSRSRLFLFHLKGEDLFLIFRLSLQGELIELSLASREDNLVKKGQRILVAQKVTNYLLNFLWLTI